MKMDKRGFVDLGNEKKKRKPSIVSVSVCLRAWACVCDVSNECRWVFLIIFLKILLLTMNFFFIRHLVVSTHTCFSLLFLPLFFHNYYYYYMIIKKLIETFGVCWSFIL